MKRIRRIFASQFNPLNPLTKIPAHATGSRDMSENTDAILIVNERFYRALSLADFSAMEKLWLDSEEAVCVHPGWPPLHGWPAIRESWRSIFQNQGPLHVWPTEAQVRLVGVIAEVICLENIDTAQVPGAGILQTRATNIFRRVDDVWKLLEHHAVPLSVGHVQRPDRFSNN
jgi:ketosteroid isomerase-like protein